MPNIQTFDSNTRAPVADQAGSQAYEIEGRHVEADYAAAGQAIGKGIDQVGRVVEQHDEIQETSANSKAGAAAFAELSQSVSKTAQQAAADPDNADKYWSALQQHTEDTIGAIGTDNGTEQGKRNAESIQATLRNEATRQVIGARSDIEGQQVLSNLGQMKNGFAQAVSNNPTMLPTAIKMLTGSMDDQLAAHPNLRPEEIARIHSEFTNPAIKDLGISAFQTMAQNNPEAAKAALTKGTFAGLFSGEEIGTLTRYADAQAKALTTAQKAQIEQQKQADKADFNARASQIVGSMLSADGSLKIPPGAPQQIIALSMHPGAEPGEIKSLADMTQSILKDQAKGTKIVSDPATYQSFGTKMVQGNLSAQEIYEARTQGQLSDKDTAYFLRGTKALEQDPAKKEAEKQFNQWVTAQKPAFTKSGNLLQPSDPHGAEKFNQFAQDAHARFEQTYAAKGDWQGLLNAKNPGYLGGIAKNYMHNAKGASLPPPVHVTTVQDALKLKPGTQFIGGDGVLRTR